MNKRDIGSYGEDIAENYLKQQKYKIVDRNFHAHRNAEIDIIAQDGKVLVFLEVKLRSSLKFGGGLEAITAQKQNSIRFAANYYLAKHKLDTHCRFDVLEILLIGDEPKITHIKDAF